MNETFSIGEIAIYVRPGSPYYGREVEILGPLVSNLVSDDHVDSSRIGTVSRSYDITNIFDCPFGSAAPPEWLRKKQQKRDIDQLVSWDDCLWQPKKVTA